MGAVIQHASSPLAGYEQGYVVLGGLLLAGGIISLLFIRPEADRARLAAHTVMLPRCRRRPGRRTPLLGC
jgi:MFS transporter, ACS family, D-galactonate transporter